MRLTQGSHIACHNIMSPAKPPRSDTPAPKEATKAKAARAPAAQDGSQAWGSYDDAVGDDWTLSDERELPPAQQVEATGKLAGPKPAATPAPPAPAAVAVPPGYKLVAVTAGGPTFELSQSPMTVGRGAENDLVLADASVSRAHARLEYGGKGWRVVDLNSGNGVHVRGRRVDVAELAPGTEVAIGQVRLQIHLQAPAEAPAQAPVAEAVRNETQPRLAAKLGRLGDFSAVVAPLLSRAAQKPKRPGGFRPKALAAGVAALAIVALSGRAAWHSRAIEAETFARCQAGIKAFGAQKWDEAEQALADAHALNPEHALTRRYQTALIAARRDAATLADVSERLSQGDLKSARQKLAALADTVLTEEADKQAQAYGMAATQVALQAETALQAGLSLEANTLLLTLGDAAVRPDTTALAAWAGWRQTQAPLLQAAHQARLKARRIPSFWDQAQTQSAAMRASISAFRRGSAEHGPAAALAMLRGPQSPVQDRLVVALKRFSQLWQTALVEHRGKRAFAAIKLFTEARALAVRIVGEGSAPGAQVDGKLADMYYVLGVQALMNGQLAEASEALHTAIAHSPRHALSLRKLDELEERASRMVDEAEFMRVTHASRAQDMLRQVVQAMPAGSQVGLRARKLLAGGPAAP